MALSAIVTLNTVRKPLALSQLIGWKEFLIAFIAISEKILLIINFNSLGQYF